jgi:hypothetical protein
VIAVADNSEWRRYRRRGVVTAVQRDRPWTWKTAAGDVMHSEGGDWAVTDDSGHERAVAAAVFDSSHQKIGPRQYRRTGVVLARKVATQEVVSTLEGDAIANQGDWILRGEQGERWPVSDEQFEKTYEGPID